jgi:hypothetical protein
MLNPKQRREIIDHFAPKSDPVSQAANIVEWSQFFLGDEENQAHWWIRDDTPQIHYSIYEGLWNDYKFFYETAPREFAKSTTSQLVDPLYRIYYGIDPYILLLEKNEKAGYRVLDNLKYEVTKNPKLLDVYGELKPTRGKDDGKWSMSETRFNNGVFIRCVGMMGDVRGSLDRMYRYSLIIANDPQNMKTMREPGTLEAHIEFWERDVEYALDSKHGRIRLIGNMLGPGCLLEYVTKDPKYDGINFSALVDEHGKPDLDGRSIWEARHSTKALHRERDNYKVKGRIAVFMAERMNIIVAEWRKSLKGYRYHDCSFLRQYGQNVLISDEYPDPIPVNTYVCIDPAYSKADTADPMALVTIALGRYPMRDYAGNPIFVNGCWVLDVFYGYSDPSQLIGMALEQHRKYYYRGLIIEANGPQEIFEYIGNRALMQDEFCFNNPIDFVPVKHITGAKEDRIYEEMQPRISLGQFFIRPDHDDLQRECDLFVMNPRGVHILDAIAMGLKYADVCIDEPLTYDRKKFLERRKREPVYTLSDPVSVLKQIGVPNWREVTALR